MKSQAAIHFFGNAASRLRVALTSYRFESDFCREVQTIERIANVYASRISPTHRDRLVWRAVCQYRAQSSARRRLAAALANLLALLALPFTLLLLRPNCRTTRTPCEYLKVDFHPAYAIPAPLVGRTTEHYTSSKALRVSDLIFALRLFVRARVWYPELLFKFVLWISSIRPALDDYAPEALIQYCEYSAHSSLRKEFLNAHDVRLVNVTHGEELISVRSAFSSFDEYYAWDLTPAAIHEAMHIEYHQVLYFNPCAHLPRVPHVSALIVGVLWPALHEDLDSFCAAIDRLSKHCTVVLRRHPNPKYQNHYEDYRRRLSVLESDPNGEDAHRFIDRTSVIVGYMSALLLQAALRGRKVVYLKDSQLASLMAYHDYYQGIAAVDVSELSAFITREWPARAR